MSRAKVSDYGMNVDIYDPWASPAEVMHEYNITSMNQYPENDGYSLLAGF